MVFIEHRGSGPVPDGDVSQMESRWDTEWAHKNINDVSLELQSSENWKWIKKYLTSPGPILEAGCGLAKWVKFFQDQGYDAYGVDYSKVAIETSLNRWPGLHLICGDLRYMDFANGYFKGIVSFGAIEHDQEGPEAILHELHRVLAADGILYCTVPCFNYVRRMGLLALQDWIVCNKTIRKIMGRKPDAGFFEYVWTPKEYSEILIRAGFEIIELVSLKPPEGWMGKAGSFRNKVLKLTHAGCPWLMPHMMAGICRKV